MSDKKKKKEKTDIDKEMTNLEAEDKLGNFEIQNYNKSLLRRVYNKFVSIFNRNAK